MGVWDRRRYLLHLLLTDPTPKVRTVAKWNTLPTDVRLGQQPRRVVRRLNNGLPLGYNARGDGIVYLPHQGPNPPDWKPPVWAREARPAPEQLSNRGEQLAIQYPGLQAEGDALMARRALKLAFAQRVRRS